jgi:hypothetical protein
LRVKGLRSEEATKERQLSGKIKMHSPVILHFSHLKKSSSINSRGPRARNKLHLNQLRRGPCRLVGRGGLANVVVEMPQEDVDFFQAEGLERNER